MGKLGEAVVEVRADLRTLNADLGKAEAGIGKFVASSSATLAGLGAAVGLGSIAAVGGAIYNATIKAANLGETLSKVGVVFGTSAGVITGTADELARKFGLVKQEVLDAAANLGLVGQAAGLTQLESAKLGSEMARLAADAASFFNVPLDVALEKIRAGLVGESEPIRAFGVLLSEDAVKAEALRLGLAKTAAGVDDQAKVMARASLIVRGMTKASGDLERTQDSTANQLRKFQGEVENFKAEFGKNFLGPLTSGIQLARELAQSLDKVFGHDAGGGVGEELKAWSEGLRLVNKQGAGYLPHAGAALAGMAGIPGAGVLAQGLPSLQNAADAQAGVTKGGPAKEVRPSAAATRAAQLAKFLANRKADDDKRADQASQAKGFRFRQGLGNLAETGKGIAAGFLKSLAAVPDALSADKSKSNPAKSILAAAAANPLFGGAGAKLAFAGVNAGAAIHAGMEQPKPSFASSQTLGADEFARHALSASIDYDPNDAAKEQVDLAKEGNAKLDVIAEGIREVARNLGEKAGAVLRGRS